MFRGAEYPELPGCAVSVPTALEAIERLEALRIRMIIEIHQRGERPPRPRPPLRSGLATLGPIDIDEFLAEVFKESLKIPESPYGARCNRGFIPIVRARVFGHSFGHGPHRTAFPVDAGT